ncbi:MAG: hypothetical protein VZR09_02800 [Candidatus Gastranaerophilaceae bacterium]|nr:hypothetical protein [Candidatus Gastranaerophilaceae bacterium]
MQNYVQNGQVQYTNNLNNQASQPYVPPLQPAYNPGPQQAPACSAVNIQIFNPAVNPATGAIYPAQTGSAYDAGTNGGCYPSNYYTTQPGGYICGQQPYQQPINNGVNTQYPYSQTVNQSPAGQTGFYDASGKYYPYVQDQHGNLGYIDDNGQFNKINGSNSQSQQSGNVNSQEQQAGQTGADSDKSVNSANNAQTAAKSEEDSSKADIQTDSDNSSQDVKNSGSASDNNQQQQNINDSDEKSSSVSDANSSENSDKSVNSSQNAENATEDKSSDNTNSADEKGFYDKDGKYHEYAQGPNGEKGYINENGQFVPLNSGTDNKDNVNSQNDNNSSADSSSSKEAEKSTEKVTEKASEQTEADGQKTKKIKVVALSNDYIKTLENYLDSQDVEVRKMGAHEIVDRLNEDPSRKDDPALTALVNKMLQDPSASIRAVALSIVESRMLEGDNLTVKILKKMQKTNDGFGLDATQAASALLKMAGKTVEKEVPVVENEIKNKSKETK